MSSLSKSCGDQTKALHELKIDTCNIVMPSTSETSLELLLPQLGGSEPHMELSNSDKVLRGIWLHEAGKDPAITHASANITHIGHLPGKLVHHMTALVSFLMQRMSAQSASDATVPETEPASEVYGASGLKSQTTPRC